MKVSPEQILLPLAIFLPFLLAVPASTLGLALKARAGRWLAIAFVPALLLPVFHARDALAGNPFSMSIDWVPALGLDLAFRLDGYSLVLALIVAGIGFLVMFYASSYLGKGERHGRFYTYLLLFGGAMLGLVLTDNLIAFFAFWEMTSLMSFLLIGFWDSRKASQEGAVKALIVTAFGGLALLAGVALLGIETGTWTISQIDWAQVVASDRFVPIASLLLLAAFTKSAQLPFHLWLPTAMEAPTPVSAYLHSATMVKAGVILMAKFNLVFAGTALGDVMLYVGLLTMFFGSWLALRQTDLKALLAYSTISQLGLLTALLGTGDNFAATAHLVNHAVFKAALFMVVGVVDHQTGSRDIRQLSGLVRVLPVTAWLAVPAALSMAGLPPFGGFISKELFYENALLQGSLPTFIAVAGSVLTFAYCLRFLRPFFGRLALPKPEDFEPAKPSIIVPFAPLSLLVVLFGLVPFQDTIASWFTRLAQPYFGYELHSLTLWHGFNQALQLSILTWILGTVVFILSRQVRSLQTLVTPRWNANTIYHSLMRGLVTSAEWVTRVTQGASFATHLRLILGAAVAVGVFAGVDFLPAELTPLNLASWTTVIIMLVGAAGIIAARSRITMLIFMGLIGYGSTMLYLQFRAPDLALTQLLIETVTIILFLSGFRFLPRMRSYSRPPSLAGLDAIIGLGVGLTIATLLLSVQSPVFDRISDFYLMNSKTLAGGDNVVNVILVDFRGFDTMGEISVLAVVAVSIYALLRLRARPPGAPETKSMEEGGK